MKMLNVDASSMFLPVTASRNKTSEKPEDLASTNDFTIFQNLSKKKSVNLLPCIMYLWYLFTYWRTVRAALDTTRST